MKYTVPSQRRGHQCQVRRAAANVAAAIVRTPSTPVMEELRRQGQQRCKECRTLLGYASLDSDSEDSIKRLTRVLGTSFVFAGIVILR